MSYYYACELLGHYEIGSRIFHLINDDLDEIIGGFASEKQCQMSLVIIVVIN